MTDGGGWGWGWGVGGEDQITHLGMEYYRGIEGGEGGHDMEVIHSRLCRQILVVGRASRIVRSWAS